MTIKPVFLCLYSEHSKYSCILQAKGLLIHILFVHLYIYVGRYLFWRYELECGLRELLLSGQCSNRMPPDTTRIATEICFKRHFKMQPHLPRRRCKKNGNFLPCALCIFALLTKKKYIRLYYILEIEKDLDQQWYIYSQRYTTNYIKLFQKRCIYRYIHPSNIYL